MAFQRVTITLPKTIYQRVQQRSQQMQRTVAEEITAVVAASIPEEEKLPADIEAELAQLKLFTDQELWQAARLTAPSEQSKRMQTLLDKQQLEGLTEMEQQEASVLSHFFNRVMLVRAKTAVLLKERGYDISQILDPSFVPESN